MAKTFKLDILACDKYFFSGDCEEVIFPSIDGSRGVMAGQMAPRDSFRGLS